MDQKVLHNDQLLIMTRFWATGEPCLWITDPEQIELPKMEFVGGHPDEYCIFLKNLTESELAHITSLDGTPLDVKKELRGVSQKGEITMTLQNKKMMPPPWLAYREMERYSMGWRMGCGEDYIYRFADWLDTLSPEEQAEYRTLFPEPITWQGWWDDDDTANVLEYGEFLTQLWQPNGEPKYTRQWIQQEFAAGRKRELCLFWGHQPARDGSITKSCLSQWWMEDFYSIANSYLCMEQYMMASKAELFGDQEIRKQILDSCDPKQMKALGRKVQGFDQAVWDKFKYRIVLSGNWLKFSQNRELREFLLSTGDSVLVEASPYDNIWGIQLSASSLQAQDPHKWHGQNLLGFALMEVRDELRRVTKNEMMCDWNCIQKCGSSKQGRN